MELAQRDSGGAPSNADANAGGKEADPDSFSSTDWLEDEAAHLERSLLRDYARLAQVRLEMQRSKSLSKDLDETLSRIEARELKVTAELAGRAAKLVHSDCTSSALHDSANPAQRNMQTAKASAPVTSNAPRLQTTSMQAKVTQPQDPVSAAVKAATPQSQQAKGAQAKVVQQHGNLTANAGTLQSHALGAQATITRQHMTASSKAGTTHAPGAQAKVAQPQGTAPVATKASTPQSQQAAGPQAKVAPQSGTIPAKASTPQSQQAAGAQAKVPQSQRTGAAATKVSAPQSQPHSGAQTKVVHAQGAAATNSSISQSQSGTHKGKQATASAVLNASAPRPPQTSHAGARSQSATDVAHIGQMLATDATPAHSLPAPKEAPTLQSHAARGVSAAAARDGHGGSLGRGTAPVAGSGGHVNARLQSPATASPLAGSNATGAEAAEATVIAESIPVINNITVFKHEPTQSLERKDWREEEKLFEQLARVAASRPRVSASQESAAVAYTGSTASVFSAHAVAQLGVRAENWRSFEAATRELRECREMLKAACAAAGLPPLDEQKLAFDSVDALACLHWHSMVELPAGFLRLLEAAEAAGAVRVVQCGGVWHLQQGERAGAPGAPSADTSSSSSSWSPPAADVTFKVVVDMQGLPVVGGERVGEAQLSFQIKVREEAPVQREVVQKSQKPVHGSKKALAFLVKAKALRVGRKRVYIRLGIQPSARPPTADAAPADSTPKPPQQVRWGAWSTHPLLVHVSSDSSIHVTGTAPGGPPASSKGEKAEVRPAKRKAAQISSPRGADASHRSAAAATQSSTTAALASPPAKRIAKGGKAQVVNPPAAAVKSPAPVAAASRNTRAAAAAAAASAPGSSGPPAGDSSAGVTPRYGPVTDNAATLTSPARRTRSQSQLQGSGK